jgi:hypothetical protein
LTKDKYRTTDCICFTGSDAALHCTETFGLTILGSVSEGFFTKTLENGRWTDVAFDYVKVAAVSIEVGTTAELSFADIAS